MDTAAKLAILADAAKYDASCASGGIQPGQGRKGQLGDTRPMGICHSFTPDGRCVSLLKLLLTNFCMFDCKYCINRITSPVARARFTVAEVVQLTLDFYRRNYIEGLFLSSGIIRNSDYTMEQLIRVAKTLRHDHGFAGYIHLKTIPGAADELVAEAGRHADRLSINIELPTPADLQQLAPDKNRPQLEKSMLKIRIASDENHEDKKRLRHVPAFAPGGQSTQMIVGATPTPDREILATAQHLYHTYRLRRVYYSAFSPIPHADPRLPAAAPLLREHRLYQADWMLRFYGYRVEEITATGANLDLEADPKLAWALANRWFFPVDLQRASREELLRVPGLGVRSVQRLLAARRRRRLTLDDLARLGVPLRKAAPFVITAGRNHSHTLLDSPTLRARLVHPAKAQMELGL